MTQISHIISLCFLYFICFLYTTLKGVSELDTQVEESILAVLRRLNGGCDSLTDFGHRKI